MKVETEKTNRLKKSLRNLINNRKDARLVVNRYRTVRAVLCEEYPGTVVIIPKEKMLDIIKSTLYVDRLLRQETEGEEEELKRILSEEKQIELGYGN